MSFDDEGGGVLTEGAIGEIEKLAIKASGAKDKILLQAIPNHPRGDLLLVNPNGTYEILEVPGKPRTLKFNSVDQIAPFVKHSIDKWSTFPIVYFNPNGVTAKLDEGDLMPVNAGSAFVNFAPTVAYSTLLGYHKNHDSAWLRQKSFMILLRITLADCIDERTLLSTINALSSYESMEGERTTGVVTRNRESLGKDIQAELKSNAGDIPEQLILSVRLFQDPALVVRRRIVCKLETDPNNGGSFALLPMADELEGALDLEMNDLGDLLRSSINGPNSIRRLKGPDVIDAEIEEPGPARPEVPIFYGSF